jgi:hypothetical protein
MVPRERIELIRASHPRAPSDDAGKSTAHIHNARAFGHDWQTGSGERAGEWTAEGRD